ncbi:dihydropteroate synthase [Rhodobacteraceae bacterium W635]|uniref:dihydropteroate synthase n=1 Tax=Nioella halotolerans TaxID=2303578 RepID=UPI000E3CC102|nr:dihydropteroate synthase [Rhodobacteraceae bacterium W635]
MPLYYRPIAQTDPARPVDAQPLAGTWAWFTHVEELSRGRAPRVIPAAAVPPDVLGRLTAPRMPVAGLALDNPRIMGILNLTPDSFSDGGEFNSREAAMTQVTRMLAEGAHILDVGGESTRPGAQEVPVDAEIARTVPVIEAIRAAGIDVPISIDTRKAPVARAALVAGAGLINDVSAFTFDTDMPGLAHEAGVPVCLMHAQGLPETMQDNPEYTDVLLDVYDSLETSVARAEAAGIPRARILVDPGIGFGKRDRDNLALIGRISLFHALGCPLLLGVSRKASIGRIGAIPDAHDRGPASAAIGLWALGQGVQMLRVHDTQVHRQMIALWRAAARGQA